MNVIFSSLYCFDLSQNSIFFSFFQVLFISSNQRISNFILISLFFFPFSAFVVYSEWKLFILIFNIFIYVSIFILLYFWLIFLKSICFLRFTVYLSSMLNKNHLMTILLLVWKIFRIIWRFLRIMTLVQICQTSKSFVFIWALWFRSKSLVKVLLYSRRYVIIIIFSITLLD